MRSVRVPLNLTFVLAAFLVLSLPGFAQQIDTVIHSARSDLSPGDVVHVIMTGSPGGFAEVEIMGVQGSEAMTETSQGRYEANITVPGGMDVRNGTLMVTLFKGGRQTIKQATQPITILPGPGGTNQPIGGTNNPPPAVQQVDVLPSDGSTTSGARPKLAIAFPEDIIDMNSVVLSLDRDDVSSQCVLQSRALDHRHLAWTPGSDLSPGRHTARVSATDINGQRHSRTWSFTVPQSRAPRIISAVETWPKSGEARTDASAPIAARFPVALNFRAVEVFFDNKDISREVRLVENDRTIRWEPPQALSLGGHKIFVRARGVNGEFLEQNWIFKVVEPKPTAPTPPSKPNHRLSIGNLQTGQLLGSRFVISGTGVPGTTVRANVEYPKMDLISQLAGVMLRLQGQAVVDNSGRYSINIDAGNVRRGQPMNITLSDNISSPVVKMAVEKGQHNQAQPNAPTTNTNNSSVTTATLTPFPADGKVVNTRRPQIGANFNTRVDRAQLLVDGKDFTNKANFNGTGISWQPGYDLDQSKHQVLALCWLNGKQFRKNWTFQIARQQRHVDNQNKFAVTVLPGWSINQNAMRDPDVTFQVDKGSGDTGFSLGVTQPISLKTAFDNFKREATNNNWKILSEKNGMFAGVPASIAEIDFGSGQKGAIIVATSPQHTYIIMATETADATSQKELETMLTSFEILK